MDQCRPPLSHRCVQLLRHILLFPEQLSAQCCLQTAGSKANAGTDQTTRLSNATAETSLHIVASLLIALSLVPPVRISTPKGATLKFKRDHSASRAVERCRYRIRTLPENGRGR
jgi:hypothetical protein